jgi:hypothetical protein
MKVGSAARAGNPVAKLVSNNRYVRLSLTHMGGGTKTPALRFGNAQSEWGKFLSHVDLRPGQVFSRSAPKVVKRFQKSNKRSRRSIAVVVELLSLTNSDDCAPSSKPSATPRTVAHSAAMNNASSESMLASLRLLRRSGVPPIGSFRMSFE